MLKYNKLDLKNIYDLAKAEELYSKKRALQLFDKDILDAFEVGTWQSLSQIHHYLFQDVYSFAGSMRDVNISKGNFRFASALYLVPILKEISAMPQSTFDEIVQKYVEMNIAHPFREGNGRSTRIWLDCILKKELSLVVDWSLVDKEDYLSAMERSPVKDIEIKHLIKGALTNKINDRVVYMKGIDASYDYEGYSLYKTGDLS